MTIDTQDATWRLRLAGFDERQVQAAVQALVEAHESLAMRRRLKAKFDRLEWMLWIAIALNVAILVKLFV
jgi:hypothetical protein